MNYRLVVRTLGIILLIISASMIPSIIVSIIYKEESCMMAFSITAILLFLAGICLRSILPRTQSLKLREGFLIVSATWVIASLTGSIPLIMSGAVPDVYTAIFEATSGITTTGGSSIANLEALPMSINFWRCFMHWMGGLGVLTIAVAILPALGVGGFQIAKAESANTSLDKMTPKMTDMAKLLYLLYFFLTILCIIFLLIGGMNLMDSMMHAFSAVATGGFSPKNTSVGFYNSSYIELVIMIFMFFGGVNFALTFSVLKKRKPSLYLENPEFRLYGMIVLVCGIFISFCLFFSGTFSHLGKALITSFFHVVSLMTTTGLCAANYDLWPSACVILLFILCFVGGCAGSTAGSIKVIRIYVALKLFLMEFKKRLHPRAVYAVKLKENDSLPSDKAASVLVFILTFILCCIIGAIVVSFDPSADLGTAVSAAIACITNVGIGFADIGPAGNYSFFAGPTKLFLSFLMVLGRLELYTIMLLFTPFFWNPDKYR